MTRTGPDRSGQVGGQVRTTQDRGLRMSNHGTEETGRDRPINEVQRFREELRLVVQQSGLKQSSSNPKDDRALTNLLGVGRTQLTDAIDPRKDTLPAPYLVKKIGDYCDHGSPYLVEYRSWVEKWLKASSEEARAALLPRPRRQVAAGGSDSADQFEPADPGPVATEAPTDKTDPEHAPAPRTHRPTTHRPRALFMFGAVVVVLLAVAGIGISAGWWSAEPTTPAGPSTSSGSSAPDSTTSQAAPSDTKELPPPTGTGPWPYRVENTGALGVFIRSGPRKSDVRLPGNPVAFDNTTLFADCQVISDFDPEPDTGAGGRWLNIHWPEAASPAGNFVYAAYAVPIGHNGAIPSCL